MIISANSTARSAPRHRDAHAAAQRSDERGAVLRRARLPGCVVAAAVAVVLAPAAVSAATWHRCPSYRVVLDSDGSSFTTRLNRLRAQGVSCKEMRRVLHRYFFGPNRTRGPLPSDGVRVGHWLVLLRMGGVYGSHGRQHFSGQYTVNVS